MGPIEIPSPNETLVAEANEALSGQQDQENTPCVPAVPSDTAVLSFPSARCLVSVSATLNWGEGGCDPFHRDHLRPSENTGIYITSSKTTLTK